MRGAAVGAARPGTGRKVDVAAELGGDLVAAASRIGPDLIVVCVDFDERVLRMGFGDLDAVKTLKAAGINVTTNPGLRMGLAVADGEGFSVTPTALFLEAEDRSVQGMNAMHLSKDQVRVALARLSLGAKAAAILSRQSRSWSSIEASRCNCEENRA